MSTIRTKSSPGSATEGPTYDVFVCYRRVPDEYLALALFREFRQRGLSVFLDRECLRAGAIWEPDLLAAARSSRHMLVLIGKGWAAGGRLAEPTDIVAREIATAIEHDVTITPVLLDGTAMPTEAELPRHLVDLRARNAAHLDRQSFTAQATSLAEAVGRPRRKLDGPRPWTILASVMAVAAAALLLVVIPWSGGVPAPATEPAPASASSPPVIVTAVTGIESSSGDGTFVLPEPVTMSADELAEFNASVGLHGTKSIQWYSERGGGAVDDGQFQIVLKGNQSAPVQITDLALVKTCGPPLTGTLFHGFAQGSGEAVQIGFDLDAPVSEPREMIRTAARGLQPSEDDWFDVNTLTLAEGESATLTISAYTVRQSCAFSIRIVTLSSEGLRYQDVDYGGYPFVVSAFSSGTTDATFVGYRSMYAIDVDRYFAGGAALWMSVDPRSFAG